MPHPSFYVIAGEVRAARQFYQNRRSRRSRGRRDYRHGILAPNFLTWAMIDTVRIPRPKFPRKKAAGGRVEHDSRGNAVWRRTRAEDAAELTVPADLAVIEDPPAAPEKGARKKN